VVGRNDNLYFTDPAFGSQADHRELDFYGVYHVPPKGPMKVVAKPSGRPNGIAISPNGKLLYVTNSDEKNIRVYDIDKNGDTANERVVVARIDGVPGGLRVNERGDLYVATAKGVAIFTAEGKTVRTITMHDRPSNLVFDPDGKTLYVTARGLLYRLRPETDLEIGAKDGR
jgi:gluconolactonase